jgi:hypothetical protein
MQPLPTKITPHEICASHAVRSASLGVGVLLTLHAPREAMRVPGQLLEPRMVCPLQLHISTRSVVHARIRDMHVPAPPQPPSQVPLAQSLPVWHAPPSATRLLLPP